jgi:hypothetical protein
MKKLVLGLMGLAVCATVLYAQVATRFTSLAVDGNIAAGSLTVTGTTTIAGYARAAQVDTNETTTVTAYTPTAVGQILVGGAGEGTNGVWISKGTTTNDWVQVAP